MSSTDQVAAASNYWSEFQGKFSDRLKALAEEAKGDPKIAHEKFIKDLNFTLEFAVLNIWKAYSEEQDNGERKIDKEASLRFFDALVRSCESAAVAALQDYAKYSMKYYSSADSGVQDKRNAFLEKAGGDAMKEAKEQALSDIVANAQKATAENIANLTKAIKELKEAAADASTDDAQKQLETLEAKKKEQDTAAEEKKAAADKKAEEAKAKKQAGMTDEQKQAAEKKEAEQKEKADKAEAEAAAKKEAAETKLNKAVEDAGDDIDKVTQAIADAKKDKGNPDTSKAEAKLAELNDKATKELAKTKADEKWAAELNEAVEKIIKDQTADYKANYLTKLTEAFDKFFEGGNKSADDYELPRDHLKKILTIGAGDFEGVVQGLGFKVTEADVLEALNGALGKKEEGEEDAAK